MNAQLLEFCHKYADEFAAAGLPTPPPLVVISPMTEIPTTKGKVYKKPAFEWKHIARQEIFNQTLQALESAKAFGGWRCAQGRYRVFGSQTSTCKRMVLPRGT